ncbi:glycosylated lysosomal membrane protein B-like [Brevipalpus obovatus]|uniref:glycosylated lysosomal membrane protein B-like n=1 Tax=Brevipalpus obovatus TaxID=246614 RepID=UPI003D9F2BC5
MINWPIGCLLIIFSFFDPLHGCRELKVQLNPGCDVYASCTNNPEPDLVYASSSDAVSEYHFIASTVQGLPGFLVSKSSSIAINWDDLLSIDCGFSFNVIPKPENFFGIVFDHIFGYDSTDFSWELLDGSLEKNSEFIRASYTGISSDGLRQMTIKIKILSDTERYDRPPELLFTPDSLHLELIWEGFMPKDLFTKNLSMHIISPMAGEYDLTSKWSLDFPPFAFDNLNTLSFKNVQDDGSRDFVNWKSIVYLTRQRASSESAYSNFLGPQNCTFLANHSPIDCFGHEFGPVAQYKIAIDINNDDDYSDDDVPVDFASWSFVIGLGQPPKDQRLLYYIIGIASLFSLFLCNLITLVICCVKRCRRDRLEAHHVPVRNRLSHRGPVVRIPPPRGYVQ